MKKVISINGIILLLLAVSCSAPQGEGRITRSAFGKVDTESVYLYTITFPGSLEASVTNYGGIVTHLSVPDRTGRMEDVVLGYDNLDGYLEATPYFGAIIGRYGNRIANGRFLLEGSEYQLARNNGPNSLHGGLKGFDKVVWEAQETFDFPDSAGLVLRYVSPEGEEGYPGRLTTTVTYTFTPNDFRIRYEAETDRTTVLNLTQHSYFNLSGDPSQTHLDHTLLLNADTFLPVDSTLIPTGEIRSVSGTPFDFTDPKPIGADINEDNDQIHMGGGYDHCWVLNGEPGTLREAAVVFHPGSGREMRVHTTEPGIQFYAGNFLDGSITGKQGIVYSKRSGFCLETQHFPDSPNQPDFPSVVLRPGERFISRTVYSFNIRP